MSKNLKSLNLKKTKSNTGGWFLKTIDGKINFVKNWIAVSVYFFIIFNFILRWFFWIEFLEKRFLALKFFFELRCFFHFFLYFWYLVKNSNYFRSEINKIKLNGLHRDHSPALALFDPASVGVFLYENQFSIL